MNFDDPNIRERFWHTASHVMAHAVKELFPDAKLAIGPAIADGFYYDFDVPAPFTPEDLSRIEQRMADIVRRDLPLVQETWASEKAIAFFEENSQPYKAELIRNLGVDEVSVFKQGDFIDLCRGPHVERTGLIKEFKLLSVAGAYWRGDENRQMLQRIYGTAFPDKKGLEEHIRRIEEAQKRDHRKLGVELDLFSFHDEIGAGLALYHPKGGVIRNEIEAFWRAEHLKGGYQLVFSPHIGKAKLWETSGHLGFYRENMYSPIEIDEQEYFLKPMNCPFHILMYKSGLKSYREMPVRLAELGTVYRYERSGVLHGLLRVRGFTQDDAHIICRPDQMEEELGRVLGFSLEMLRAFGFDKFHIYLSTRPKGKCVGEPERWETAQAALRAVVTRENLAFDVDEGGGAFYGPKIDIKIKDALEREWQCSTIQFDFNLPERFDMVYVAEDGKHHRPYMIHRALLGSLERFFAVLLENCGGEYPVWLAPVQVKVVPIKDVHLSYARQRAAELQERLLRVEVDETNRPMGAKVREAKLAKIPYTIVVGDKEVEANTVSLRLRDGRQAHAVPFDEFQARICRERDTRALSSAFSDLAK